MKPFEELSLQGQIRRYHQLAWQALRQYPLTVKKIRCITVRYNVIFRVDAEEGIFALRISGTQNRTALQIRSEMQWIETICHDTDIHTACPLHTKNGELMITVENAGLPHPRHVTITRWLYGKLLSAKPTISNIRQLGQALARLHYQAENYKPSGEFMTFDDYKVGEWGDLSYLENDDSRLTLEQKELFREAITQSEAIIQHLRDEAGQLYLINNDLHLSNAVAFRGKVAVFDFDDCRWGHFIQDLSPALFWMHDNAELTQSFLAGYCDIRPLPCTEKQLNYALVKRAMSVVNFMVHYRSHQPERLQSFIMQAEEIVKNLL